MQDIKQGNVRKNNQGGFEFSNFVVYSDNQNEHKLHEIILNEFKQDALIPTK